MTDVSANESKAPAKKAASKKAAQAAQAAFGEPVNAIVDGTPSSIHRRVFVTED